MISLKSPRDIEGMRRAGQITAAARELAGNMVRPGVTTLEIDTAVRKFIESQGAKPSFLGYGGFPGSACISVNEQVIHGIPGPRKLKEGDIVSVDVGATLNGFVGDNAATFPVGDVSQEALDLLAVTKASLFEAIAAAQVGARLGDVCHAVEAYCSERGYGIVREYCGHGIGREMHEDPEVPNYGKPGHGVRLMPGMTFCIEPMINQKGDAVRVLKDGWTVVTANGSLSAHFEHEIAVTKDGPVILTRP